MSTLGILGKLSKQLGYQAKRFHGSVQDNRSELMRGNKPILAFIRNPYSWYVSWYKSLQRFPEGSSVLFDLINTNNFIDDINKLFDMFDDDSLLVEYNNRLNSKDYRRHPASYSNINTFKQATMWDKCGLLSWNYHWLIFGNGKIEQHDYTNVTIGKQETMIEDRLDFFRKTNLLTLYAERAIMKDMKINVTNSNNMDYRTYYDDNLIERVAQKEKYIIDRYGYTFD